MFTPFRPFPQTRSTRHTSSRLSRKPNEINPMGTLKVKVSDISGSRTHEVEAPDDVAVNRILAVLVERMNLPLNSPDGQLMSYKLHHRRTGSQLLDNQTFAQANVLAGDEL